MNTVTLSSEELSELSTRVTYLDKRTVGLPSKLQDRFDEEEFRTAAVAFQQAIQQIGNVTMAARHLPGGELQDYSWDDSSLLTDIVAVPSNGDVILSASKRHPVWAVISEAAERTDASPVQRATFLKMHDAWISAHSTGGRPVANEVGTTATLEQTAEKAALAALCSTNRDYATLPPEAQELYRGSRRYEERRSIRQALHRALFGCDLSLDDLWVADVFLGDSEKELLAYSELLTEGIGDDFLFIESSCSSGNETVMSDSETLYDWIASEHFHLFRSGEADPGRSCEWDVTYGIFGARLIMNRRRVAVKLSTAACHVSMETCQCGREHLERLKLHNPDELFLSVLLTDWMNEPDSYWFQRQYTVWTRFEEARTGAVYMAPVENVLHMIFSDVSALKTVRLRHFAADVGNLLKDGAELDAIIEQEKALAREDINRRVLASWGNPRLCISGGDDS